MSSLPTKLTQEYLEELIVQHEYNFVPNTSITICILFLQNGAKLIGKNYGAINSNNQDWELAKELAYEDAFDQLWELEGYLLRQRMFEQSQAKPPIHADEMRYVEVKMVRAKPMTGDAFKKSKGLPTTPEIKTNDEGYQVTYEDGYVSWSPKEVFEKAYTCVKGEFDFPIVMLCHQAGAKVTRPHHITRNQLSMPEKLNEVYPADLGAINWTLAK